MIEGVERIGLELRFDRRDERWQVKRDQSKGLRLSWVD